MITEMLNDTFGRNVRERRQKRKMSVAELAETAKCTEYTIYNIENGRQRGTRLGTAKLIAEALDCTVDDLIGAQQTSEARQMALQMRELRRKVLELSQENRNLAQALAALTMERAHGEE